MASYTLADIRAAAEKKYGDVEIDGVVLTNALRLPKEVRKSLTATQDKLDDEGEERDQVDLLRDTIMKIAKDRDAAEILLDEIGDDLSVLAEIFSIYSESTKAGEA